jgi:hypothetical protein
MADANSKRKLARVLPSDRAVERWIDQAKRCSSRSPTEPPHPVLIQCLTVRPAARKATRHDDDGGDRFAWR